MRAPPITAVELRRVLLPMTAPLRSAIDEPPDAVRDVLLVRVRTPEADGWGECAAQNAPLYSAEYVDGAHHVLRHHLVPRLLAGGQEAVATVKGNHMAKAALEMAALDAQLRAERRSLAAWLGADRDRVDAGVVVGIPASGSIAELVDEVTHHVDAGYRRVKLKIRPGWDLEPVAAVRDRFDARALSVQADANASYRLEDADHLARLDAFALLTIEQPLPEDDLDGHAQLARTLRTPVCLDESIVSLRAAIDALDRGACSVVCVKPGRLGGLIEARRVHDVCQARGVPVWCGGMLETGIGRAANLALAALRGFTLPGDLSASGRWFLNDLTPPMTLDGEGRLAVPTGPGIGVDPLPDALAEATTSVEEIRP